MKEAKSKILQQLEAQSPETETLRGKETEVNLTNN